MDAPEDAHEDTPKMDANEMGAPVQSGHLEAAVSYETYRREMKRKAETEDPDALSERDQKYLDYITLNDRRTDRVHEEYRPSDRLRALVEEIERPQTWLVITEDWCGDSAQVLPIIAEAAELNGAIDLRILPRDEHLELMDEYRTDGKRAIPKLVALDEDGTELFTYGPRPTPAAELFERRVEEGTPKKEVYRELQQWYNGDRGAAVDEELAATIERILSAQPGTRS